MSKLIDVDGLSKSLKELYSKANDLIDFETDRALDAENNLSIEMAAIDAATVKIGESINDTAYESAANSLLNSVNDLNTEMDNTIGDLSNLLTDDKNNLVNAINEVFQNASSGKQLIADAIGEESITADSTFSAMSEAITLLKENGVNPNEVKQVGCGNDFTVVLKKDGTLWTTGKNNYGQLGLGDTTARSSLTQVTSISDVKNIMCGNYQIFAIKKDGTLWGCGRNNAGQLGLDDNINKSMFEQITENVDNVKQVVCSGFSTFLLKTDGSLWACGQNGAGTLGFGDNTAPQVFTQVTTNINNDVAQIACGKGSSHAVLLKIDGSVWTCGSNDCGELALGDTTYRNIFTQVTTNINYDVKQIACGMYHTAVLKNDGTVWTCGYNTGGQLGIAEGESTSKIYSFEQANGIENVKQIACNNYTTLALKEDNSLWATGNNTQGALGLNAEIIGTDNKFQTDEDWYVEEIDYSYARVIAYDVNLSGTYAFFNNSNYPICIAFDDESTITIPANDVGVTTITSTYVKLYLYSDEGWPLENMYNEDETAFVTAQENFAIYEYSEATKIYNFIEVTENINNDVEQVICGGYHTAIIKNGSDIYVTGQNTSGELGLGDTENRTNFVLMYEIKDYEELISEIEEYEEIVDTNTNRLYELMSKGGYDVDSSMNLDSLLDLLELSGISIPDIRQIVCGSNYTFVLKNDGSIWSCGRNNYGQLGLNDTDNKTTFTQVTTNINNDVSQIACGQYHTFVLKNDGSIWSCGANGNGTLGLGDTTDRTTFTQVTTNINNDVKQIACNSYHTFILKNDGSLWSCGNNDYGQLGLNDTDNKTTFTQVTTNINNDVSQIACGNYYTFILKTDGSVWSCGANSDGELGLGTSGSGTNRTTFTQVTTNINNDVKQIACGHAHVIILKTDGSIYSCGLNEDGQLGLGDTTDRTTFTQVTTNTDNVKQISCGYYHTVILKNDGSLWSCGWNEDGQLGTGLDASSSNKKSFTQVTTNINNDVKQISCGNNHTFIVKNDDTIWSCGYNYYGQLGLGTSDSHDTFVQVPSGI